MRHIGTVTAVDESTKWGFIDRQSLKLSDGTPTTLDTANDIYLHQDDCGKISLSVGIEVGFNVLPDRKRPNSYRAVNARQIINEEPGIELHIDEKRVDNPSVPMRYCFLPPMLSRMKEGFNKGHGYAVLIVAKKRNDSSGYREIRDVRTWSQTFTITTFGSPGEWDVSVILYERIYAQPRTNTSTALEEGIKGWLLSFTKNSYSGQRSFDRSLPNLHDLADPNIFRSNSLFIQENEVWGRPIAVRTITVNVPRGVFAKEPPKALLEFGNYFFKHKAIDQCDFRRRLGVIMVLCQGWVPYLLWELAKRAILAVCAGLLFLFFVQNWWILGDKVLEPRIRTELFEDDFKFQQVSSFNRKEGLWHWFTPGFLLIYAMVGDVLLHFGEAVAPSVLKFVKSVYRFFMTPSKAVHGGVVVHHSNYMVWWIMMIPFLVALGLGAVVAWKRSDDWRYKKMLELRSAGIKRENEKMEAAREYVVEAGRSEAALADRQFTALVCGDAPAVISLEAIPKELRKREMLVAVFLSKVCRPFAR